MDGDRRVTSMDFLNEFTQRDEGRIKKYIGIYLSSAVENIPKLQELLKEENWDELKKMIHSIKPHFDIMGMKETKASAEKIESILLEKKNLDVIPEMINDLVSEIELSLKELG